MLISSEFGLQQLGMESLLDEKPLVVYRKLRDEIHCLMYSQGLMIINSCTIVHVH